MSYTIKVVQPVLGNTGCEFQDGLSCGQCGADRQKADYLQAGCKRCWQTNSSALFSLPAQGSSPLIDRGPTFWLRLQSFSDLFSDCESRPAMQDSRLSNSVSDRQDLCFRSSRHVIP